MGVTPNADSGTHDRRRGLRTFLPEQVCRASGSLSRRKEKQKKMRIHGMWGTRVYAAWRAMHSRCTNPRKTGFSRYGGRGISVCERWNDFTVFFSDMGEPPEGHQLDRINNDGNYEPRNCRWADRLQQAHNRRRARNLTFNGETLNLAEWSRRTGISRATLGRRFGKGLPADQILSTTDKAMPSGSR